MKVHKLLSFKLFVIICVVLTLTFIIKIYVFFNAQLKNYEQIMTQCAKNTSLIIRSSTRQSMLLNQKDEAYKIIQLIEKEPNIEKIRIYDKNGIIAFSTDSTEISNKVDINSRPCSLCHGLKGETPSEIAIEKNKRVFRKEDGTRLLGFITPIRNEPGCYTAQCHFHKADVSVLGLLDIILSLKETDKTVASQRSNLIKTNTAITLALAFIVGTFIWIFVYIPIAKLLVGTKEISSGNLDYKIQNTANDEVGVLADSFNKMTEDLRAAKQEITEWSNGLEKRVEEKTKELKDTQERMLQVEKMASLGKLAATVAHELNNPMAGILTYSKLIQRKLQSKVAPGEKEFILSHLKMIETESDRCGKIIKDLLLFSRKEKSEISPHQLNSIIEKSLQLISHHLKLNNIKYKMELQPGLPDVSIDQNQIKQALLALYVNGVEAMEQDGLLTIKTQYKKGDKWIYVYIQDNGKGIPENLQQQIFEPFFTTKTSSKNFGLGLSVAYGIITNHQGEIKVESEINKGTTFIIKLPVYG